VIRNGRELDSPPQDEPQDFAVVVNMRRRLIFSWTSDSDGIFKIMGELPTMVGSEGAVPALLHPREMVLPAPLSERVQRGLPLSGGGDTHTHLPPAPEGHRGRREVVS
jgi:hypothetical protein